MSDSIIKSMFDEVVGDDKRNKQVAGAPVRTASTGFDIASWNAILSL